MRQFTLKLTKDMQRPVTKLQNWHGIRALLDTGAIFPIWTDSEEYLVEFGGVRHKDNVEFGGFGGAAKGNLFILPSIVVGDLIYPNIPIIASRDLNEVPFQLILSATMFSGLIYEIDDYNHKLNITIPDGESNIRNMAIKDSNGRLHVLCGSGSIGVIFHGSGAVLTSIHQL